MDVSIGNVCSGATGAVESAVDRPRLTASDHNIRCQRMCITYVILLLQITRCTICRCISLGAHCHVEWHLI